jgi:hypothetical protein
MSEPIISAGYEIITHTSDMQQMVDNGCGSFSSKLPIANMQLKN